MALLTPTWLDRFGAAEVQTEFEPFAYYLTPGGGPIAGANWNLNGNYAAQTNFHLNIPAGRDLFLASLRAVVRGGGHRPDRWGSSAALTTGWQLALLRDWGLPTEAAQNLNGGLAFNAWGRFAAVAHSPAELTLGAGDDYWLLAMRFGETDYPFVPVLRGGRDTVRARIGPTDNLSANTEVAWLALGVLR